MREFTIVKHSRARLESAKKVSGEAVYTDDMTLQGMVFASVVRSPYAWAQVTGIDLSAAQKVPGYVGSLLPSEVPDKLYNCSGNPPSALLMRDERILTLEPKCAGDRILCVAAETKRACLEAAAAVAVKYEVKKPFFSIRQAVDGGEEPLQPHLSDSNILWTRQVKEGDAEEGFRESDFVLEDSFHVPPMQHTALEPTVCICDYKDGFMTIWSNSQTVFQERRILSELTGLPETHIRIIKPTVGGGFGARQQLHSQPVAALLSMKLKRPVKIVNTREEELYASVVRHEGEANIKIGARKDGRIVSFYAKYFLNTGPYTTHGPTVLAAGARKFQYSIPNYFFDGYCVLSNTATAGAFRGYGNTQLAFAREVMIDRVAQKTGLDPFELRLMNHVRVGGHFPGAESSVTSCQIEQCAEICRREAARIDDEEGCAENDDIRQAWGVAFGCHGSGPSSKEGLSSAVIMANDDGSVQLLVGSADIGQGSETMLCQIAAEQLRIPLESIRITAADTAITPYDMGTFGSSQTYVCGNAVSKACQALVENLRAALGSVCKAEAAYDGTLFHAGGQTFSFGEAVRKVMFSPNGAVVIGSASYKAQDSPNPFIICMAKAEYHRKLNAVRLLHIIECVDIGTPINPLTVKGQMEGGIAQGVGYTMTEQIEINYTAQKPGSSDLLHYKVPLMADLPRLHVFIAESYEPSGPCGAKSVGELTTVPVSPAIVNAVRRASGQEITKLPLCGQFLVLPNEEQEGM